MNNRPPIPPDIKLEVRKKCKFGCVICRCPVYDYEHLVDYCIVQKHEVDNINLLCPKCHRLKGNGSISKETILEHLSQVSNNTHTKPEAIFHKDFKLILGNNEIESLEGYLFKILDKEFFKLYKDENGTNIIDAIFYDKLGNPSLIIEKSEYTLNSDVWDINYESGLLTFRNEPRDIFLKVKFDDQNKLISIQGKFFLEENLFLNINENGIFINEKFLMSKFHVIEAKSIGMCIYEKKSNQPAGFLNCAGSGNTAYQCEVGFAWSLDFLKEFSA